MDEDVTAVRQRQALRRADGLGRRAEEANDRTASQSGKPVIPTPLPGERPQGAGRGPGWQGGFSTVPTVTNRRAEASPPG